MFTDAFAGIAAQISQAFGGPYHAARVITSTPPEYDEGGSIVTPGQVVERACLCQVDAVTEAMRTEGFTQGDVRLLIIRLAGDLDTDARVSVDAGPHEGVYSIQAVSRDPLAVYRECRGRAVTP
jgi:hypothetical protein